MSEKDIVKLYRTFFILGDSASLKILFELERYGEKTFSELRDNLSINPATLSKKLKILVQTGLIVPDKSHDHLRVFYSLHQNQKPLRRVLDALERLSTEL
ncbi:MAG: DNA-binding HxlR family transcriptional regulator [Candidatus Saccharimonadales bacterium]|jgi:DNA-binding HxlR family transcriptional regulator